MFETSAGSSEAQREVVTMLKSGGLTLEEVACMTFDGWRRNRAHRAYERLRHLMQIDLEEDRMRGAQ